MVLLAMEGAAVGQGLAHSLAAEGWSVRVAQDASQALEQLFDELPAMLVVVEPLPDGRAVELVGALRRLPGGLVPGVVIVTTDPSGGDETVDRWVHPSAPWGTLVRAMRQVARFRGLEMPVSPAEAPSAKPVTHGWMDDAWNASPAVEAPRIVAPRTTPEAAAPPPRRARPLPAPERPLDESGGDVPLSPSPAASTPLSGNLSPHLLTRAARERLAHEVHVVEAGDPWAALGVPRRSPLDLVERAATRMEARYTPYLSVSDPVFRDLGARMLACVRHARRRVRDEGLAGLPVPEADVDPFGPGHALLTARQWEAADAFFTNAREEFADSAVAMAGQGWARFHNPTIWRGDREKDGEALMELAVQFDATLSDTQARLARLAQARGRPEVARARALLALKHAPRHTEALAVLRELGFETP